MGRAAFLDEAVIEVIGGRGGNGSASFHRTKRNPRGGPDGGNGGDGGSVFAKASSGTYSLVEFVSRRRITAGHGLHGSGSQKHGAGGEDCWIKLPLGTEIIDEVTGHLHASLLEDGDTVALARGGEGGRGNITFKTSTNRAPRTANDGDPGEERTFRLSLRLLADIGLVGLPNAGKSSLLNAIANTNSPIGAYPFTTLRPQLGMVELEDFSQLTVTDMPGIIEGASEGTGLGLRFLRHISRTKALLHVVDASAGDNGEVLRHIDVITSEMGKGEAGQLLDKPRLLVLAKSDLLGEREMAAMEDKVRERNPGLPVCSVSAERRVGLAKMIAAAGRLVRDE